MELKRYMLFAGLFSATSSFAAVGDWQYEAMISQLYRGAMQYRHVIFDGRAGVNADIGSDNNAEFMFRALKDYKSFKNDVSFSAGWEVGLASPIRYSYRSGANTIESNYRHASFAGTFKFTKSFGIDKSNDVGLLATFGADLTDFKNTFKTNFAQRSHIFTTKPYIKLGVDISKAILNSGFAIGAEASVKKIISGSSSVSNDFNNSSATYGIPTVVASLGVKLIAS